MHQDWVFLSSEQVETLVGLDPWLILLRYSHFEEIHF
jgi:hypothetical protein